MYDSQVSLEVIAERDEIAAGGVVYGGSVRASRALPDAGSVNCGRDRQERGKGLGEHFRRWLRGDSEGRIDC